VDGVVVRVALDVSAVPINPAGAGRYILELARGLAPRPEIDLEETDPDSAAILEAGLETVVTMWEALGAVDSERRLTVLGLWGLPAALRVAWTE
jgi:hypothetical protein